MALFNHRYPYTDFHELNLDWLLETYQMIVDDIKDIQGWIENHQIEYEEALRRLTIVESEINTFEARIEAQFDQLSNQIRQQLEDQQRQVEQLMSETRQEIARMLVQFENEFRQIEAELLNTVAEMRAEVLRYVTLIQSILDSNNQFMMDWVNRKLQEFINSLPEILTVQVYNPYRGIVTDIQTAINDIYSLACIWGLTAQQYDSLGLTASEYDALQLTATQYDTLGYRILYKDPTYYMTDPFTGDFVMIKEVVYKLADLHKNALTASEYDALELDADTYDAKELSAYDYDWNGYALLP